MVSTARMAVSMVGSGRRARVLGEGGVESRASQSSGLHTQANFSCVYVISVWNCGAGGRQCFSLPVLYAVCFSNDPPKPYSHRHERCRRPRSAQHARQEAGRSSQKPKLEQGQGTPTPAAYCGSPCHRRREAEEGRKAGDDSIDLTVSPSII